MQIFTITKGATSVILPVSIFDSSSTTGGKLTGLVFNTASLTAYYNRSGASGSAVAITLATATKGTWATGGFVAVDGTNMPGDYELHIPNAALITGVNTVLIQLKGAANMVPKNIQINLIAANLQDTVRLGLTALPAIAAGSAGGVPVIGTGTNQFKSNASANVTFANTSIATVTTVTTTTTLTNLPAITANWLTAAGIAASALNGKGDWNVGKTGYSLTQSFPSNFANMSISVTTGLVDITQTAADKVWGTAARILTASTNFNDIAATDIVSAGAITTLAGAVVNVDLVDTMTTYTGNTLQTGNVATLITTVGTAGAGLTDLGGMSTGMKAEVNTEAKDVLFTDTDAEPAQGTPGATVTLAAKIGYLYKAWRNKSTQTATTYSLFNDDTTTVDHKATVSDDATTATKGEVATGP